MTASPDVVALTDELYARPPAEFVGRRDALSREARAGGDRALAAEVKALRRPSVGAWYLNAGVRAGLASLQELLDLGGRLRDAQSSGDFAALRDLGSRRGAVMTVALRELGSHLTSVGVVPTPAGLEEARTTMASALANPDVAEQLARGRLDRPHVYAGFGDPSMLAQAAPPAGRAKATRQADATPQADEEKARTAREEAARRELGEAEAELAARVAERESAQADAEAATRRVDALTQALAEARDVLQLARRDVAAAEKAESSARKGVERARQGVTDDTGE